MNIFATSDDPVACALALDDKRVIKMAVESTQLLSSAVRHYGYDLGYKYTHANHPCGVWTRTNSSNFIWLWQHAIALCDLYEEVYERKHGSITTLIDLMSISVHMPKGERTPFVNATEYKGLTDTHKAYRIQLSDKWNGDWRKPTWHKRHRPDWYMPNRPDMD